MGLANGLASHGGRSRGAFAQEAEPAWRDAPVTIGDIRITNVAGEAVVRSDVGEAILISTMITNSQSAEQQYAYIVQVNDADDITGALMWVGGELSVGESRTLSVVWIPPQAGVYEATALVWESTESPVALAPKSVAQITVAERGDDARVPSPNSMDTTISIADGAGVPGCEEVGGCYVPMSVEVGRGALVTWENNDVVSHTVVAGNVATGPSGEFDSLLIYPGERFRHVFNEAGDHAYYCIIHPWMSGVVMVPGETEPTAPAPVPVTPPVSVPEPRAPVPVTPPTAPQTTSPTVMIPEGTGVPGCEETDECYLPHTIEVDPGTTVTWDNIDTVPHTVTAGSATEGVTGEFDSSLFLAGSTFEHTFEEAGEYPYYCIVHPWQAGVVVVRGETEPPAPVPVTPPVSVPEPPAPTPVTPPTPQPAAPQTSSPTVMIPAGTGIPVCERTDECYLPPTIEVDPGTTVTWENADAVAHTVTAGSPADGATGEFDSSLFLAGDSFEHTFEEAGEYPYYCIVHPWMTGVVMVRGETEPPAPPVQVTPPVSIPEPPTVPVTPPTVTPPVSIPEPPTVPVTPPTVTPPVSIPEPPTVPVTPPAAPQTTSPTVIIPEGTGIPGCEEADECYLPHTLEVGPGTTVMWDNIDTVAHTVTAGSPTGGITGEFDSSILLAGNTFEHTFEDVGDYPYYCIVHPWMTGAVMVR